MQLSFAIFKHLQKPKMKKVSILAFALCAASIFSQNFDKAKLDEYFDVIEKNDKAMGSVALSKDGQLIYSRQFGFADVDKKTKANANTQYRIGSISKTFTAVLVMKAVEENKLKLSHTIDLYFPGFPNGDKITVEMLLRHRSGIYNFTDDPQYKSRSAQPKNEAEMLAIIAGKPGVFAPGSQAAYSNSNYVLLSYVLQRVQKQPYGELLRRQINVPLGLTNTYFSTGNTDRTRGYTYTDKWTVQPQTDASITMGAGGIVSTPVDLVKFSNALFGGKLLKPESLEKMTSTKDGFGLGLISLPFYEHQGYGHTGGIDGFASVFGHFADGDISFAQTMNGFRLNTNDVSIALLSAAYGKDFQIPVFTNYKIDPAMLSQYVGVYQSTELPLDITVTQQGSILQAQGSGQPAFPLSATAKDEFSYEPINVVMKFDPATETMVLLQNGGTFHYKKQK